MTRVGDVMVELRARTTKFIKGMKKSREAISELSNSLSSISRATGVASAALAGVGVAATAMSGKFEKQMTRTAAVAAGGKKGFRSAFKDMSQSALKMAGETQYTANEVGQAMQFMAMAGMGVTKTMDGIPAVLQLAAASGVDLAQSADTVTNIMAGMGVASKDLGDINNVLIGTFTGSNVSLTELGESFKMVGPVAKNMGIDVAEVAAAFGMMGNAGIKSTMAGTGMRKMLLSLYQTTPKATKAMKSLGIGVDVISGPDGSMSKFVQRLVAAREELGNTKWQRDLQDVFGIIAVPKIQALISGGAEGFDLLGDKIAKARKENIAFFLQQKQLETLAGRWDILKSAVEKLAIKFGDALAPAAALVVRKLTGLVNFFANMDQTLKSAIVIIGGVAAALLALTSAVAGIGAIIGGFSLGVISLYGSLTILLPKIIALLAPLASLATLGVLVGGVIGVTVAGALAKSSTRLMKNKTFWQLLSEEMRFATESMFGFEQTIKNFIRYLLTLPLSLLNFLGVGEALAGFGLESGADEDYYDAFFTEAEKDLHKFIVVAEEARKKLEAFGEEFGGLKRQGRIEGILGAKGQQVLRVDVKEMMSKGATHSDWTEAIKQQNIYRDAINKVQEAEKKLAESRKNARDEESKRLEERKASLKRQSEEAKKEFQKMMKEFGLEPDGTSKDGKDDAAAQARESADKFLETLNKTLDARLSVLEAGELGGVQTELNNFQRTVDEVQDAAEKLGVSSTEMFQRIDELTGKQAEASRSVVLEILKRKRAAQSVEEFEKTLSSVNKMMAEHEGLSSIDADEVTVNTEKDVKVEKKPKRKPRQKVEISLERQRGTFESNFRLFSEKFGSYLLSTAPSVAGEVAGQVGEWSFGFGKKLEAMNLGGAFGKAVADFFKKLPSRSLKSLGNMTKGLGLTGDNVKKAGAQLVDGLSVAGGNLMSSVLPQATGIGSAIGAAIGTAIEPGMGTKIGQMIGQIVESVILAVPGIIKSVMSAPQKVVGKAFDMIPDFVDDRMKSDFGKKFASVFGTIIGPAFLVFAYALGVLAATIGMIASAPVAMVMALGPITAMIVAPFIVAFAPLLATIAVVGVALLTLATAISFLVLHMTTGVAAVAGIFGGLIALATKGFKNEAYLDEQGQMVRAPEEDAWSRLTKAFTVSIDMLVGAMQPFIQTLFPLAGLFHLVMRLLVPFAKALSNNSSIAESLFYAFKELGIVVGEFMLGFAQVWNIVIPFFNDLLNGFKANWHELFKAIADWVFPLNEAFGALVIGLGKVVEWIGATIPGMGWLEDIGAGMVTQGENIFNADDLLADAILDIAIGLTDVELDESAINDALNEIRNATYESAGDLFDDIDGLDDAVKGFSESLTNVPSGYKVALERWRAIGEEGGPLGGVAPGELVNVGGGVGISEMSSGDYFNRMYMAIREGVCWALVNCCGCSGSVSEATVPNATWGDAMAMQGAYAGASNSSRAVANINIENLYASDGEDFRRQIERAIGSANYNETGSPYTPFINGGSWRS